MPEFNMQKRHRDALTVLRNRRDIIFVDADKNLGLVCLDVADYERRCIAELAQTHHEQLPHDEDRVTATRSEIIGHCYE